MPAGRAGILGPLRRLREQALRFGQVARDAVDLIYPPVCVVCACDAPSGSPLCERCLMDLEHTSIEAACGACGKPVGMEIGDRPPGPCPWCDGRGVGRIKAVARLGLMQSPLRELIHQVKFHGRWELASWLGRMLVGRPAIRRIMEDAEVVVPVPLHALRQTHRGYNQAALIARELARPRRLPVLEPAVRAKATVAQTALTSVAARQANLRDAFVLLDPAAVAGKRIALVDDVMTTGATLRSFAWCLSAARPERVSAVVAALADPRGKRFEEA
jgi:ComF family protein